MIIEGSLTIPSRDIRAGYNSNCKVSVCYYETPKTTMSHTSSSTGDGSGGTSTSTDQDQVPEHDDCHDT